MAQNTKKEHVKEAESKAGVQKKIQDVEKLEITSAKQWRKENINARKFQVPSGAVFMVRNVPLVGLVAKGVIPLSLVTRAIKMKDISPDSVDKNDPFKGVEEDDIKDFEKMLNAFVSVAVIEPKISDENTDDENVIPVSEINFIDKSAIFHECQKGGAEMYLPFL